MSTDNNNRPALKVGDICVYCNEESNNPNKSKAIVEIVKILDDERGIAKMKFHQVIADNTGNGYFEYLVKTGGTMNGSFKYLKKTKLVEATTEQNEFDFILDFIKENITNKEDFNNTLVIQQLRSLWTAYCLHQDCNVDTGWYDSSIITIWSEIVANCGLSSDEYERFYNSMCEYLV